MTGYNAQHQRNIDAQSEDEYYGKGSAYWLQSELQDAGTPEWLADAVVEAVANGDLAYLKRQVERHVPGWVTP